MNQDNATRAAGSSAPACWAVVGWTDGYGNVKCAKCGKVQSPTFKACVWCCPHDTLDFTEEWHGPDKGGEWALAVECGACGKNFDFDRDEIIANYQAVRRKPNKPAEPRPVGRSALADGSVTP